MADAVSDAFIDSLKVLAVVAVCTYIIALKYLRLLRFAPT